MSSLVSQSQDIDQLDEAIKQLRIAYERYFAGQERLEPTKEREAVKRELRRLITEASKNTARRFRLQSLQATVITYEQHWNRICRQIEEGTFLRDRRRAERILAQPIASAPGGNERSSEKVALPASPEPTATSNVPDRSGAAAPKTPSAEPSVSPEPDPIHKLHGEFVRLRQSLGELQPVPFDSFAASLSKQADAIKARLRCQEVEFKVATKDGKAILKASPRGAAPGHPAR